MVILIRGSGCARFAGSDVPTTRRGVRLTGGNRTMPRIPRQIRTELSLNQIDLNLLRVFDVLIHERSVTRTADRIGRTQSAVSHALGRLRNIFNDELFEREGSVMVPTPRALELAAVIGKAIAEISDVVDRSTRFEPETSPRNFRVGLSDYTAVAFLPQMIDRFAREAPKASLNILHTRESEVVELLRRKEVECVILGNFNTNETHLNKVVLSVDKMVCAGWRGNPLLAGLTAQQYQAAEHLQISADGRAEGVADIVLRQMNLTRKVVATIPHYLVAPWVIKGTSLITAFGDSMLLVLPDESETVIVAPPIPLPDVVLTMIYDRYLETDLGHAWLRRLIASVAHEQKQAKEGVYGEYGRRQL